MQAVKLFLTGRILLSLIACLCLFIYNAQATSAPFSTKNDNPDFGRINAKETEYERNLLYREQYGQKMISFMNQSIDPCEDFYEYACGNWKNTIKPRHSDMMRGNLFDIHLDLADMVENLLRNPKEELKVKYENEIETARTFYESCMQADLFPLQKSDEYLEVIRNISGFPAIDENWKAEEFDWFNATAHLSIYGVESFVRELIIPFYPFVAYFQLPDIGFDMNVHSDNIRTNTTRGYILNEQRMRIYLTAYGVLEPKTTEVVNSIFELWRAILNLRDEFNNDAKKCIEIGATKHGVAKNKWEKWRNYAEIVWNGIYFEDDISECPCAYFYMKLDEIFQEHKEAVANYLAMKFLYHLDTRLESKALQKDYCNQRVEKSFKYLVDQLYMAHSDFEHEKREVTLMTEQMRAVYRQLIKDLDWLDEVIREKALLKESAITLHVGRTESIDFMDQLIKEINKLEIEHLKYDSKNIEMAKFEAYMERYSGLHHKNLDEYIPPPVTSTGMQVQAGYIVTANSIVVMRGIINTPAYHKSWPWSLKYGSLGFIIGHELTHSFNVKKHTYRSKEIFEQLTKCYVDQFNEYELPQIHRKIDGERTQRENIADHGGLRIAFKAYQRHIQKLKAENNSSDFEKEKLEQMPGLNFEPEQIFYLGFAQLWCSAYKEEDFWHELENKHTNDKYRVLGSLSNTAEFAEAFNCPVGSKMNLAGRKCKLL